MRKQQGISLLGLIIVGMFVGFFALLGFKMVPAYVEYFGIKSVVKAIIRDTPNASPEEVRKSFDTRGVIESISTIQGEDLDITPASPGKGGLTIVAEYNREVPVIANISLKIHFTVNESAPGGEAVAEQK